MCVCVCVCGIVCVFASMREREREKERERERKRESVFVSAATLAGCGFPETMRARSVRSGRGILWLRLVGLIKL